MYVLFVRTFCTYSLYGQPRGASGAKRAGKTVLRFSLNPFPAWKTRGKIARAFLLCLITVFTRHSPAVRLTYAFLRVWALGVLLDLCIHFIDCATVICVSLVR